MTWFKIDDQFADHVKVIELQQHDGWKGAIALWTLAGSWCSRHLKDGEVPTPVVLRLGGTPEEAALLVRVGLWLEREGGYAFHDWAAHNPLRSEVEAKREAQRDRVKAWRERKRGGERNASRDEGVTRYVTHHEQRTQRVTNSVRNAPVTPPPTRPDPDPIQDINSPPRDPLLPAAQHPGVADLHEAWKAACGFPKHRFRGPYDGDAGILADAIRAYGLADCLAVAEQAPSDGMVSGKADDKGRKHDTIRYIFGNPDAFNRILRAAHERAGKSSRKRSAAELVEEASRL